MEEIQSCEHKCATADNFGECTSFDNLYRGMKASCRNVRWKQSVLRYENNGMLNTHRLKEDIENGTYKIQKYQTFEIFEPKKRTIVATRIRDRQFQHALVDNYVYDELTRHFIADNCACQKGRGIDYCLKRFKKHLLRYYTENGQSNDGYYAKLDIENYFGSIDHEILKEELKKYIHDECILAELYRIIDSYGGVGLGLGSQCNQLFALTLLNGLDHFIKEQLKIKFYIRYMDDFILLHQDRDYLRQCVKQIEDYIERLHLRLNKKKTMLHPIRHGMKLLKWRVILTDTGKVVLKMNHHKLSRQKKKIEKLWMREKEGEIEAGTCDQSMNAFMANCKRGDTFSERCEIAKWYYETTGRRYHDYA